MLQKTLLCVCPNKTISNILPVLSKQICIIKTFSQRFRCICFECGEAVDCTLVEPELSYAS